MESNSFSLDYNNLKDLKKDVLLKVLLNEIQNLRLEVQALKVKKYLFVDDNLNELWDNEFDEKWNDS